MKKLLIAALLGFATTAGITATATSPAAADTNVKFRVILGVPYYTYRAGPDYVYRKGYGWYRPGRNSVGNITCSRAGEMVRRAGYRAVDRVECAGSTYTFRGIRNGKRVTVYVNSRNGAVYR